MSTLPGQIAHTVPSDPRYVVSDQIKQLWQAIRALQTANPLQATTITEGVFEVDDDNGNAIIKIGDTGFFVGGNQSGMTVRRADGSMALSLTAFVALWDKSGDYVVTDDSDSGQGLARPYLFLGSGVDVSTFPTITTTSSTWATLIEQPTYHQHPKVKARVLGRCSDGTTTGDVRMIDLTDGSQVGDIYSMEAGAYGIFDIGPAPLSGAHLTFPTLALQARRTGGNGTVGIRGMGFWGTESASV